MCVCKRKFLKNNNKKARFIRVFLYTRHCSILSISMHLYVHMYIYTYMCTYCNALEFISSSEEPGEIDAVPTSSVLRSDLSKHTQLSVGTKASQVSWTPESSSVNCEEEEGVILML